MFSNIDTITIKAAYKNTPYTHWFFQDTDGITRVTETLDPYYHEPTTWADPSDEDTIIRDIADMLHKYQNISVTTKYLDGSIVPQLPAHIAERVRAVREVQQYSAAV